MSTIGLQPSSPPSAALTASASKPDATPHTANESEMAHDPMAPSQPAHNVQFSERSPILSPDRQRLGEIRTMHPASHPQRSPLVSQSVPRSLPAGAEQNPLGSTSPFRRAGTESSPPPMYRGPKPSEQVPMTDTQRLDRPRADQVMSRSRSPATSSAPSRRESVASGSTARVPEAKTTLFSKSRLGAVDRRAERAEDGAGSGAEAPKWPRGEETARTAQLDDEEDDEDGSDLESEEGGGRPVSGGNDERGSKTRTSGESRRMVETEKDSADFAYEYVPVVQRRDHREKM